MSKSRFEAFSDGVFAFAITLLVLGFALPEVRVTTNAELTAKLIALWPNGLAYVLSFLVIGIIWQNHQAIMRLVERVDRTTVFWNLMLMGGTAFIPLATARIVATRNAYRIGLGVYVLAMLIALVWPVASFVAYVGIAVYYLIPHGVDDDIATPA
jgi:uncharacterized membrane protein